MEANTVDLDIVDLNPLTYNKFVQMPQNDNSVELDNAVQNKISNLVVFHKNFVYFNVVLN